MRSANTQAELSIAVGESAREKRAFEPKAFAEIPVLTPASTGIAVFSDRDVGLTARMPFDSVLSALRAFHSFLFPFRLLPRNGSHVRQQII